MRHQLRQVANAGAAPDTINANDTSSPMNTASRGRDRPDAVSSCCGWVPVSVLSLPAQQADRPLTRPSRRLGGRTAARRFGTYSSTVSGVTEVLPTNEARAKLNQIAAGFDHDGADAVPVVFGSHRRAQGVIVSWQLWQRIAPAVADALDADLARQRIDDAGGERLSHEQLLAALDL